jgi:uncharacterized protein (DUF58 family)
MSAFPAPRRRYHFQTPGLVYVFVTILVALGAFNSQNNLLFWAFGLALAVLIVSGIISGQMLMGIQVTRDAPARAVAGVPTVLRYRVTNHARLAAAFALDIAENASDPVLGVPAFVVHVGPRDEVIAEGELTPESRGVLRLTGPVVTSAFPFGIIRKSLTFAQASSILVHPAPVELPAAVRRALAGMGRGRAPTRTRTGEGTEFFALRDYVPGDAPTRIAWRASARARPPHDLLVRQTAHEEPRSIWVVLDLSATSSQAPRAQAERAIAAAGQCARDLSAAGVPCGLSVPGWDVQIPPRGAANQSMVLLDALAAIDLARPRDAAPPAFPAQALRGASALIVHAGPVNPAFGPPGAIRMSGLEVVDPGATAPAAAPGKGAA